MKLLTMTLQAPLMTFGVSGFSSIRETLHFPSRSAVIGIVASAMGIRRNESRLVELHKKIKVHSSMRKSVKVDREYNTVRVAKNSQVTESSGLQYSQDVAGTLQIFRQLIHDNSFRVVLEVSDDTLADEIEQALLDPVFVPYIGQRSCVPTKPLIAAVSEQSIIESLVVSEFDEGCLYLDTSVNQATQYLKEVEIDGWSPFQVIGTETITDYLVGPARIYASREVTIVGYFSTVLV